jgi:D-alanine-D-alanine ligase
MAKKNIAVVHGGNSGEYEISIKSGQEAAKAIDSQRYNVYPIVIRGKDWYYKPTPKERINVDKNDFSITVAGEKISFHCVFNAIHGTPGEDGKLQGYFDMLNIPYTSCNLEVSAITFHKGFCNLVVRALGMDDLKVSDSVLLTSDEFFDSDAIIKKIGLPCFVKPVQSGSSVGVSKVKKTEELPVAMEAAFEVCNEIMVERFVKGRELTCAVSQIKGVVKTFPVAEIVSKKEFFDLEAKYDSRLNQEIIPAPVSEPLTKRIQNNSKLLFRHLRCKGIVRFDYIVTEQDEIYFLEVNTIPGMTAESIVPKMIQAEENSTGKVYGELIENVLRG